MFGAINLLQLTTLLFHGTGSATESSSNGPNVKGKLRTTTANNAAIAETTAATTSDIEISDENVTIGQIIGGTEIEPHSRPYLLSLGITYFDYDCTCYKNHHTCGGSLISPNSILTAARCFFDSYGLFKPPQWIDFHRHSLSDNTGVERLYVLNKDIVIHPNYDSDAVNNDFAVVILTRPVTGITPVKLNDDPTIPQNSGDPVEVAGWGDTQWEGDVSDVPFSTTLGYVTNEQCSDNYAGIIAITPSMLCAAENNTAFCNGDSGGPGVIASLGGGPEDPPLQVGVVSFNMNGCTHPDFPNVFARVSQAVDWIKGSVCNRTGDLCEDSTTTTAATATSSATTTSSTTTTTKVTESDLFEGDLVVCHQDVSARYGPVFADNLRSNGFVFAECPNEMYDAEADTILSLETTSGSDAPSISMKSSTGLNTSRLRKRDHTETQMQRHSANRVERVTHRALGATNQPARMWNTHDPVSGKLVVPYAIEPGVFATVTYQAIAEALSQIEKSTGVIEFLPQASGEEYIYFVHTDVDTCSSNIGRQTNTHTTIWLGSLCRQMEQMGAIIHEVVHALGFWHEQSRHDRDDHVTILLENVASGSEHNFEKSFDSELLGVPYDFASIMHFPANAFANNPLIESTIVPNYPLENYQKAIGQRVKLSSIDVDQLRLMYQCSSGPRAEETDIDNLCSPDCKCWEYALGECQSDEDCMGDLICGDGVMPPQEEYMDQLPYFVLDEDLIPGHCKNVCYEGCCDSLYTDSIVFCPETCVSAPPVIVPEVVPSRMCVSADVITTTTTATTTTTSSGATRAPASGIDCTYTRSCPIGEVCQWIGIHGSDRHYCTHVVTVPGSDCSSTHTCSEGQVCQWIGIHGSDRYYCMIASGPTTVATTTTTTSTHVGSSMYYPDWQGGNIGCKNDGHEPQYMQQNPTLYMYTSLELCCTHNYRWMYFECLGDSTRSDFYYPNWGGDKHICKNDGNAPGYILNNPDLMFESLELCCSTNYGWNFQECVGVASLGSNRWYVDWGLNEGTCVETCNDGSPSCGGLAHESDQLYESASACCKKLYWKTEEDCTN